MVEGLRGQGVVGVHEWRRVLVQVRRGVHVRLEYRVECLGSVGFVVEMPLELLLFLAVRSVGVRGRHPASLWLWNDLLISGWSEVMWM